MSLLALIRFGAYFMLTGAPNSTHCQSMDAFEFRIWMAKNVVVRADGEPFVLTSGKNSEFYINLKPVLMHPVFLSKVPYWMQHIADSGNYLLVAGMETAAIPLISAVCMSKLQDSHHYNPEFRGFFIRKETKTHGTKSQIEFTESLVGKRVLILEDVVTTGLSSMVAVNTLRIAGAIVEEVACVVDREDGGSELLAANNVKLTSLFRATNLFESV